MDNASNNTTLVEELQALLRKDGITFIARQQRIR
jgi:hypothetical protein